MKRDISPVLEKYGLTKYQSLASVPYPGEYPNCYKGWYYELYYESLKSLNWTWIPVVIEFEDSHPDGWEFSDYYYNPIPRDASHPADYWHQHAKKIIHAITEYRRAGEPPLVIPGLDALLEGGAH